MQPTFRPADADREADWLSWEAEVAQYDAVGEDGSELADSIKIAVVVSRAPNAIRGQLQFQADAYRDNQFALRAMLVNYLDITRT